MKFDSIQVFQFLSFTYNALNLVGDVDVVIDHMINDSAHDFEDRFRSFKDAKVLDAPNNELICDDIEISENSVSIGGQDLFTINSDIEDSDKQQFLSLISQVYSAVKDGYEPAIIPVNDENEAKLLVKLRDKDRQNR